MNRPTAVVCVSGGMDSLVTAALAAREHNPALLHVTYGQRTAARERRAFERIAGHFDVPVERRLVVDIAHLARIGGSSLTDRSIDVERPTGDEAGGIPSTYVPFRNANIVAIATSWAETIRARSIWLGVTEEDSAGYPDCRRAFMDAMERAIDLGTRPETRIAIETPLVDKTKPDIVRTGADLGAPFELSWSCYVGEEAACGTCDSCRRRLRAFRKAGLDDPIPYMTESP